MTGKVVRFESQGPHYNKVRDILEGLRDVFVG